MISCVEAGWSYQQTSHSECPANSTYTGTKRPNYFSVSHNYFRSMINLYKSNLIDIKHTVSRTAYKQSSKCTSTSPTSLPPKLCPPPPSPALNVQFTFSSLFSERVVTVKIMLISLLFRHCYVEFVFFHLR